MPPIFRDAVRDEIEKASADVSAIWDQPLYSYTQRDIAKKLLKLRVTFKENAFPSDKEIYKVDFKLLDKENRESAIVIIGDKNQDFYTNKMFGHHNYKFQQLETVNISKDEKKPKYLKLHVIDERGW